MSGNPSNVVPMPGSWPTPSPWPPGAVPPGCFSELARLNQCYNEVQMMEMILSKVVCDLAQNNAAFQQCLVNAIAASGSNVPLIGVTNGTDAQPGQVGQYVYLANTTLTFPAATYNSQIVSLGTLPAGDWDMQAVFLAAGWTGGAAFSLTPLPMVGFNNGLTGIVVSGASVPVAEQTLVVSQPGRALTSGPSLIAFTLQTNLTSDAASTATSGQLIFSARRAR